MASSSKLERPVSEIMEMLYDFDNRLREAAEVGFENVRETIQNMGPDLVSKPLLL